MKHHTRHGQNQAHGRLLAVVIWVAFAATAAANTVELRTDAASCRVDLDGARIVSFAVGGREVLWNDDPPQTRAADWAHGGIPLCWPWFGVDTNGVIHGTAWRSGFDVIRRRDRNGRSEVDLLLTNATARLVYRIVLTDALELGLETRNTGTSDINLPTGFHPYFRVAERDRAFVTGVDGLRYEDDPSCPVPASGTWSGVLPMTNAIDRIFNLGGRARSVMRLVDPACSRVVVVESAGASDVNVWNPGAAKLCPGIVPGDEWRRFVFVEPIRVGTGGAPLAIAPGGRVFLKMTVRLVTGK